MNQEQCVFGCEYEETGNVDIDGLCYQCGKDQRLGKCMYRVDDKGHKGEDGYCNAKAVIKYSEETLDNGASIRRCRLHFLEECCEKNKTEQPYEEYESLWTDDPQNPPDGLSTMQKLLDLNDAKKELEEHLQEVLEAIQHTMGSVHERFQEKASETPEEDSKKKS